MTLTDHRGLSISTAERQSVDDYERALGLLHGYYADPLTIIEATLEKDPDFVMGHAFRAGLMVTSSEKRALGPLADSVTRGQALLARGLGTARERQHLAAAKAWLDGEFQRSCALYNRLALEYPRDAFAVQLAHLCNFYLGKALWLRDHVAAVLPAYSPLDFSTSYLYGMHAFGLEENHEFERAQAQAERALELNPRDPWAVHALAHVCEMRGESTQGIRLLEARRQDWQSENFFAVHNWWHLALYYLDLGETGVVLELYDQQIRAARSEVILDLVDASSLLWRLLVRGVDVGSRFVELAATWRRIEEEGFYAFNDLHALIAYAGEGAMADVERVLLGVERVALGAGDNSQLCRDVGGPTCRGFAAFARGAWAEAVDELLAVRPRAQGFGGSNAQRDIIDWTLIEAATRAGQRSLVTSLIAARHAQMPLGRSPITMRLRAERAGAVPVRDVRAA